MNKSRKNNKFKKLKLRKGKKKAQELIFPSLGVHLTSLGCPPTLLVSGPAVGEAQILIWFYSCVYLPPMSTAIRTSVFSLVGAFSVLLYIP